MQHRRQPLPAYSGATTLRHDDDKHAKHLHARTRKLWIAAAVVGIVVLVMGARALLLPSLVEVEVTHSTTTDPARPQYVHPLDDRSATRRAVEASAAALHCFSTGQKKLFCLCRYVEINCVKVMRETES